MATAGRVGARGNPVPPGGAPYVDYYTGYSLALAVCAALFHRARTGEGQLVETSMLVNAMMVQNAPFTVVAKADGGRRDALKRELASLRERGASFSEQMAARHKGPSELGSPFYRTYLTRDGAIGVGGLAAQFRKRMRDALGLTEDAAPGEHELTPEQRQRNLVAHIECMIREHSTAHWLRVFQAADVPVTPVRFIEEMDEHTQVRANGYTVELEHETCGRELHVAPVHQMSATPPSVQSASPPLGRHTRAVLAQAGYSDAEIDAFYERDVVR
jgi:crotonobetainyl-CoA:carnitine CoA-transferase CaiB-like acyl-CoA transferase